MTDQPTSVQKPPFGPPCLWGARGAGKTITALNSPFTPVHVIDVENSSDDYFQHQQRLIEMNLIRAPFTRTFTPTYESYMAEYGRICGLITDNSGKRSYDPKKGHRYGTIVIDTSGQVSTWIASAIFDKLTPAQLEKMSQANWGKVRDSLRTMFLRLQEQCNLIILLAHEREYPKGNFTPRVNPSVLELTSVSVRLVRPINQKIPDGLVTYARLPFFPPRIPAFTLEKLLTYIQKPTDWTNLSEEEKAPPPPPVVIEGAEKRTFEEEVLDEG